MRSSGVAGGAHRARAPGYRHIESMLAAERCVILDGGVETEVQRLSGREPRSGAVGHRRALPGARDRARRPPRAPRRAAATCSRPRRGRSSRPPRPSSAPGSPGDDPSHWIDIARLGIQLARKATIEAGRERRRAPSRSRSPRRSTRRAGAQTIELLARMFADDPPDMLLLETLTLIREPQTYEMVELLLETGPAGVALVPALPPRRVRRLRPALGPAGGRPVRPRRAPLRGDGRRGAADQLPAGRPRAGHRLVAARLHRAAARRVPEPRPSRGQALALRRHDRPRGLRRARARLARRGRADHRRLLRRHVPTTSPRSAPRSPRPSRGRRRPPLEDRAAHVRDGAAAQRARALARRPTAPTSSRCRCRELSLESGVFVPTHGQLPRLEAPLPHGRGRRACAASTSAAAAASRPCSSRSTARRTCTRSTSTATRSRTRSRTRTATASATG